MMIEINLADFYDQTAKLAALPDYEQQAKTLAGEGQDVILTGAAPVWVYLIISHVLHGKAKSLLYRSPVTGDVSIFDHNPH
jgi:hypothetical protein